MYRSLMIVLCTVFLLIGSPSKTALAEEAVKETTGETEEQTLDMSLDPIGIYKSESPLYQIETLDFSQLDKLEKQDKEEKEKEKDKDKGILEKGKDKAVSALTFVPNLFSDTKDDVQNSIKDQGLYLQNGVIGLLMTVIQLEAELVLGIFTFMNNAEIMNYLVKEVESVIQTVSGIDSSGAILSDTGVFGNVLGLFIAISVLFIAIIFTVKRATTEAIKAIISPIIVLTIAMVLIANMSSILTQTNDITVSFMDSIASVGKEGYFDNADEEIETTEDILHHTMVYKPYMLMQYGTYDEEIVSNERSKQLLLTKDSTERQKIVEQEYSEYGNEMVSPHSSWTKIGYGLIALMCNLLISIPILIIAGIFLILQFAILLVMFLAPFALIWAVLPNQLPVLKSYLTLLFSPFMFKALLSVLVMIMTTIIAIVFSMTTSKGIVGYGMSMFIIGIVMLSLYLLKNRIMAVFTVTKEGQQLATAVNQTDNMMLAGAGTVATVATLGKAGIAKRAVMNRVTNRGNNESTQQANNEELRQMSSNNEKTNDRNRPGTLQDRQNLNPDKNKESLSSLRNDTNSDKGTASPKPSVQEQNKQDHQLDSLNKDTTQSDDKQSAISNRDNLKSNKTNQENIQRDTQLHTMKNTQNKANEDSESVTSRRNLNDSNSTTTKPHSQNTELHSLKAKPKTNSNIINYDDVKEQNAKSQNLSNRDKHIRHENKNDENKDK